MSAVSIPANDGTSISVRALSDGVIDELKAEGFFDELEEKHLTKTEFDAEEAAE